MSTPMQDHPCPNCAHRMTARNWSSETGDKWAHLCNHPAGSKPLQPACAWHSDGATMRVLSNRVFG